MPAAQQRWRFPSLGRGEHRQIVEETGSVAASAHAVGVPGVDARAIINNVEDLAPSRERSNSPRLRAEVTMSASTRARPRG